MSGRLAALLAIASLSAFGAEALKPLPLPGSGEASMDYLAFDPSTRALWIPAGARGATYVLDTRSGVFRTISGFPTLSQGKRIRGPSSAAVGEGIVYIGNRADSSICGFDARSLLKRGCVTLAASPDGILYVAITRELWVTTPRENAVVILSVGNDGTLGLKETVKLEGAPEGYAVDAQAGIFYTNLEDKDRTLAIDARTRKTVGTFQPGCGEAGPRGIVFDRAEHRLLVACTDGAVSLDLPSGAVRGRVKTGAGVDNIDYVRDTRTLLVAGGRAGSLARVAVAPDGALSATSPSPGCDGCRSVVVDDAQRGYLIDSKNARLLVIGP